MSTGNGTRPSRSPSPAAHAPLAVQSALAYQPSPLTPLRTCTRCGGKYLDDKPARAAHYVVFGHRPRRREPNQEN
jgi:hypothetical protein